MRRMPDLLCGWIGRLSSFGRAVTVSGMQGSISSVQVLMACPDSIQKSVNTDPDTISAPRGRFRVDV